MNIDNYFKDIFKSCVESESEINKLVNIIKNIKKKQGKIFFIGNGASNTIGSHFALDFSKNLNIKSHSLDNSAILTAIANDISGDQIFKRYLETVCSKGDLLIAISASGNSKNIISAIRYFKNIGKIITLTGMSKSNSAIKNNNRGINIHVNLKGYNQIESSHASILGYVTDRLIGRKIYKVN